MSSPIDVEFANQLAVAIAKKLKPHTAAWIPGALMDVGQTAAYIGMSRTSFFRLRKGWIEGAPSFPRPRNNGVGDVWIKESVDQWIASLPPGTMFDLETKT